MSFRNSELISLLRNARESLGLLKSATAGLISLEAGTTRAVLLLRLLSDLGSVAFQARRKLRSSIEGIEASKDMARRLAKENRAVEAFLDLEERKEAYEDAVLALDGVVGNAKGTFEALEDIEADLASLLGLLVTDGVPILQTSVREHVLVFEGDPPKKVRKLPFLVGSSAASVARSALKAVEESSIAIGRSSGGVGEALLVSKSLLGYSREANAASRGLVSFLEKASKEAHKLSDGDRSQEMESFGDNAWKISLVVGAMRENGSWPVERAERARKAMAKVAGSKRTDTRKVTEGLAGLLEAMAPDP